MVNTFWHIIIIFSSFAGFLLSFYIHHKKNAHESLVCPLNANCDSVINSEYSKFLGIPVETIGLLYYGLIAIGYGLFLAFPNLSIPLLVFIVIASTTAALLFSIYLTFIQLFTLRQWCTWCLISASICAIIFAVALITSELGFIALIERYNAFISIAYFFAIAVGVGTTTAANVLFLKFLKDLKISYREADIMRALWQISWLSLAILIIAGIGIYLPSSDLLNESPNFLAQTIVIFVIIINSSLLNFIISPRLIEISFIPQESHQKKQPTLIRKSALALSAISIVSWYSVFTFSMIREIEINFWTLIIAYFAIAIIAIATSQIIEKFLSNKAVN